MSKQDTGRLEPRRFSTETTGRARRERDSAYELWRRTWRETFAELGVARAHNSEDFLHRELVGLFQDGRAVGFMLLKFLDLSRPAFRDVAYFANYSSALRELHHASRAQVMVISYMTLDRDWRKARTTVAISEILMGLAVLSFLESRAERIIGYFRNNRKTNEIFYRHGGLVLARNQRAHNVEADYAEITRRSARLSTDRAAADLTLEFWQRLKQGERFDHDESEPPQNELTVGDL